MKKEELRIGNIIEVGIDGNLIPVLGIITALGDNSTCLVLSKSGTIQMVLEDIRPVKINEEYLILLGLERRSLGKKFVWVTKHYMFINPSSGWHYNFKSDGLVSFIYGKLFVKQLRFVHQIQNFHFEMTEDILSI